MRDYKGEGKEKWEAFKTEFNRDMDELGKAFKDLTVNNTNQSNKENNNGCHIAFPAHAGW